MRYTVTGSQMKQIDKDTIERVGIPSVVLMERAALEVADMAELCGRKHYYGMPDGKGKKVRIGAVCGTGNNGADGIAAGRILWGRGYEVTIFQAGNEKHKTPEYELQRQIAERLGICLKPASEFDIRDYDVVIDALFGIGLARKIEGDYQKLVRKMAKGQDVDIVAVDIPSGIHADTGVVMGDAVKASVTVTFGYLKTGLLLYPGKEYAGKVQVKDIGFSDCSLKNAGWDGMVLGREDLARLPKRPADSNKGTFGKMLLVAGSRGMCGAAYLSALAAYRVGAGLVRILTVPENQTVLQTQLPEAIVEVLDFPAGTAMEETTADRTGEEGKGQTRQVREDFREKIRKYCDWAGVIVVGPGLGQEDYVEMLVEAVLEQAKSGIVLDADGLNAVARVPGLTKHFAGKAVVTPHMGEMERLTGKAVCELKDDRVRAAREYAEKTGAVCVLKDSSTVVADQSGNVYINGSGCSAMAKAGSGDVLAGVIGGLMAQGMTREDAAAYGVYIHGLAGERAEARLGERGPLARELALELSTKDTGKSL